MIGLNCDCGMSVRIKVQMFTGVEVVKSAIILIKPSNFRIVSDVIYHLISQFDVVVTNSVFMTIDGYKLAPSESVEIFRDNDLLKVSTNCNKTEVKCTMDSNDIVSSKHKRKMSKSNINENAITQDEPPASKKHLITKLSGCLQPTIITDHLKKPKHALTGSKNRCNENNEVNDLRISGESIASVSSEKESVPPSSSCAPIGSKGVVDVRSVWESLQQKNDGTVGEGVTIRPLNITVVNKHMPPPLRCNALLIRQNEDRETNKASSAGAASSNNVVSGPSKTSFRPPPPTSKPPVALLPKSSSAAGVEKNISARNSHRTDNNVTTSSDKSIASTVAKKSPKVKINFNALPTVTIASDTRSGDLLAFRYLRLCEKTFSPVLSEFVQARVVRVIVNEAGVISLEMVVTRIDPADDSYLPGEEVVLVWAEMSDVKVVSRELEITDNEIPNEFISSYSIENPGAVCTVVETQSVLTSNAMSLEKNPEEEEDVEGFSLFDLFASDLERKKRSLEEVLNR